MATAETRKPVNELAVEDLRSFPIWEYCLLEEGVEGMDETWVRPLVASVVPADAYSLQVATSFKLSDGSFFDGFVDLTTASIEELGDQDGREFMAAMFVEGTRALVMPKTVFGFLESRRELALVLGRDLELIFPIAYELKVRVDGERILRKGVLSM